MAVEQLDRQEVFQFLRPDQFMKISDAARVVELRTGETIYTKGERAEFFYVVLDGEVSLRLPGRTGVSILVDTLTRGAMFGSCVCFQFVDYSLTAQCVSDVKVLRLEAAALKELMDEDLVMGYAIQTQISRSYFNRYLDTMKKLQAIVMNLPIETV
jgi:CRP-like cAMP-binding protein